MTARLKEAQKLGFQCAVIPAQGEVDPASFSLNLTRCSHLKVLADLARPCE
jgi:predicted ATP-dependent serine protease